MQSRVPLPPAVQEIIASDQAVAFAYVTPARGVVLNPLTNFGLSDPSAGVIEPLTSSVGMWKKLERITEDPRVAVAYHTRTHGFCARSEYVLVQGRASLTRVGEADWIEQHREAWERFAGPREVGLWEPWLRVYHRRVGTRIEADRVLVWSRLDCQGSFELHGERLPEDPRSQREPRNGTAPRVDTARTLKRLRRLRNRLLGWVGADGYPVTVAVEPIGLVDRGIRLRVPEIVPHGCRRAGLLAHEFARYTYGQHQRQYTGWLEVDDGEAVYAPHTEHGYFLPPSKIAYRLGVGFVARRGLRAAERAGFWSRVSA